MPNIGFPELVVILLVALLVFGPKKLPEMGKSIGKAMREFRSASAGMRAELKEGMDAEDLDEDSSLDEAADRGESPPGGEPPNASTTPNGAGPVQEGVQGGPETGEPKTD